MKEELPETSDAPNSRKSSRAMPPPIRVTRVCQYACEVESACHQGFSLREIIYEDRITTGRESGTTTTQTPTYSMTQIDVTKPFVTRVPLFVMQQSGDRVVANLNAQIAAHQADALQAAKVIEDLKKDLQRETKNNEGLRDSLQRETNRHETYRSSSERLQEANRKLESDLGKVRAAVGEIRMKEILG